MDTKELLRRFDLIVAEYGYDPALPEGSWHGEVAHDLDEGRDWLLVEGGSVYEQRRWYSLHRYAEDAARYHFDEQDFPADWKILLIVNLSSGAVVEAEETTRYQITPPESRRSFDEPADVNEPGEVILTRGEYANIIEAAEQLDAEERHDPYDVILAQLVGAHFREGDWTAWAVEHYGLGDPGEDDGPMQPKAATTYETPLVRAERAFWAEVAAAHPEIETGDLDPFTSEDLLRTMAKAIDAWVDLNSPEPRATPPAIDHKRIVEQVHAVLDGPDWSSDTPQAIAEIFTNHGYEIR